MPASGRFFEMPDSLLRPLPPETIFAMINSGHPAYFILQASVRAIDGIYNGSNTFGSGRPEDPRFRRVIKDIRSIEFAGALDVRFEKHGDLVETSIVLQPHVSKAADRDIGDFKTVLGIAPNVDELKLISGVVPRKPDQLALLTRPLQRLLAELAAGVDVPAADLAAGRATPSAARGPGSAPQLVHIRSGDQRPADAFAAVRYSGH